MIPVDLVTHKEMAIMGFLQVHKLCVYCVGCGCTISLHRRHYGKWLSTPRFLVNVSLIRTECLKNYHNEELSLLNVTPYIRL